MAGLFILSAGIQPTHKHTHNTHPPRAWVPRSRADMNSIQPTGESRRGRVLALLCLIYFLVILDAAIVRLALPGVTQSQYVARVTKKPTPRDATGVGGPGYRPLELLRRLGAYAPSLGLAPSWRWDPRPPGD